MLGLSTGLIWDNFWHTLEEPPQDNLVGHWDFSQFIELSGDLTGDFGSYLSGGDKIGRVRNIAPASSEKLGAWARATSNNNRPTWITGGANGQAYARFDNSSYTEALVTRSTDAANWGGNGTDKLSEVRLRAENLSIFIVGEPLDDDTDGSPEQAFSYFAYYDNPSGFNSNASVSFNVEREDDEDIRCYFVLGSGVVSPNYVTATQAVNHWNSGGVSIVNLQTSTSVGGSYVYTNNNPDIGQTVYHVGSLAAAQNACADFDPVSYDDSLTASIGIGGKVNSSGEITSDSFEGKIYEILVYKEALSEEDRAALTYYLGYKYGAIISV